MEKISAYHVVIFFQRGVIRSNLDLNIYNTQKYNQCKYSRGNPTHKQGHLYYGSTIAAIEVRRQIGKKWIYRVRPGNGFAGSEKGTRYQDRYTYYVPSSIYNPESAPWRTTLAAGVVYWQNTLTLAQKKEYRKKGHVKKNLPGYNVFIQEVMKGKFHLFVDRGDPSVVDFTLTDFIRDNAWHSLDLSAIIPTIAREIKFHLKFEATQKDEQILFRKHGNVNEINITGCRTKQTDKHQYKTILVSPNDSRKIDYKATSNNITVIDLTVRAWWT